ncbi:hypothetical protein EOI86_04595 [Hwanghaeella grinnelliae]|uniref:Uncharacterized protein n=1 Tax=Hwanghaeella grinnelliae TaxID=2500179 RepID=A0A3S2VRB6_9PROT|nr:hypothetical protein [Hwanghaeella grinnelliae]RVU38565.1 hypothetical protein EOI86_04595 [Hwanghaeella grinnelliae]
MPPQNQTHWSGQTHNAEFLAHYAIVPYMGGGYCYLPNYVGTRGFALTESQCNALVSIFLAKEGKSGRILSNLLLGAVFILLMIILPRVVEFYMGTKSPSFIAILGVFAGVVWLSNHRKNKRFLDVVPDAIRCRHGRPWRYFILRLVTQDALWALGLKAVGFLLMGLCFIVFAIAGAVDDSMRNSSWAFALFTLAPIGLGCWATVSALLFGLRFRMKNGRLFTAYDLPQISPVTGKCVPPM